MLRVGVYINQYLLYDAPSGSSAGYSEYDHIVTVVGVETTTSALKSSVYLPSDVLLIQDHGLNAGSYRLPFGSCVLSRKATNLASGPVYSLSKPTNYGFAVTGVVPVTGQLPLMVQVRGTTYTFRPLFRRCLLRYPILDNRR